MTDRHIPLFTVLITAADGQDGPGPKAAGASFPLVRERALAAEAAGIDALLLSDRQSTPPDPADGPRFEAGTLAAALAVCTGRVGIVPAISTEHALPYHVARTVATVDHLTAGRAGWQPLHSADADAAANYHRSGSAPAADRRSRAEEFATVLTGLWDSFDDDAFVKDRASATYFVPERMHQLDHKGRYFDVAGPLNIARPPQGHPPLVHRVTDTEDIGLAARIADVVLLAAQPGDDAARVRSTIREEARAAGRDADEIAVLLDLPVDHGSGSTDLLHDLVDAGAADGFTLLAPTSPADAAQDAVLSLTAAVRGSRPAAAAPPAAATLRERLGLPRPAGLHQSRAAGDAVAV